MLGINAHQALDLIRLGGQDSQSLFNGADQFGKFWAGKPYCESVEIFGTGVLCEYD